MSICTRAILDYLESLHPKGSLGPEEGVLFGSEECCADGVLVSWMATVAAIRHAIDEQCRLLISHEALTFHDYFSDRFDPEPWTAELSGPHSPPGYTLPSSGGKSTPW